jgi:hypothetical protein
VTPPAVQDCDLEIDKDTTKLPGVAARVQYVKGSSRWREAC